MLKFIVNAVVSRLARASFFALVKWATLDLRVIAGVAGIGAVAMFGTDR